MTEPHNHSSMAQTIILPPASKGASSGPFGELPCTFGKYTIEQELGAGQMGTVYLARDTLLKRPVALKVPKEPPTPDAQWVERFLQEARTASKISHPRVCRIFDADRLNNVLFLTMEYVSGVTLEECLKETGPLSSRQAAEWCMQLAEGLQQAHDRNVLHRDLKPANVMVRAGSSELVIMDFGLATQWDTADARLTQPNCVMGSPAYMAPERFAPDSADVTPVSDVFSLGVILFEMLTGTRPFNGRSYNAVVAQITTVEAKSPAALRPDVAPELADICLKMLSKDPRQRFDSAAKVAGVLKEWIQTSSNGSAANRQGTDASAAVSRTRTRGWYGLVSAAGLLLVGAVLFGIWSNTWSSFRSDDTVGQTNSATSTKGQNESNTKIDSSHSGAASTSSETPKEVGTELLKTLVPDDADAVSSMLPRLRIDLQRSGESKVFSQLTSRQLPLHDKDKVHIHVELPEPGYACLLWYDAEGKSIRLWPETLNDQRTTSEVWSPPLAKNTKEQLWHELGGAAGLEMILVLVSRTPFVAEQLVALEERRVELAYLDRQNALAVFDRERGSAGLVTSEKPAVAATPDKTDAPALVLLVPEKARHELVPISSPSQADNDGLRSLTGRVQSAKEFQRPDFREQLRNFDSYYGLVFRHEN